MNIQASNNKLLEDVICSHTGSWLVVMVLGFVLGVSPLTKADNLNMNGTTTINVPIDSSDVYTVVDEMPEIEGGISQIYEHIKYPEKASKRGVEGRVFIKFIITENGEVKNPEILKDIGAGCGEAAVEGVKKVKFKPGKKDGKPVKVYYTMPVNFTMSD